MNTSLQTNPPLAFLSYASEDLDSVIKIDTALRVRGINVWFDKRDLQPGPWKPQLTKAIYRSRFFLFCVSTASLQKIGDRPGFQDSELNIAVDIAMRQSDAAFTIVPIRISALDRGDHRLSTYQQYDLFNNWEQAIDRLALALGGAPFNAQSEGERIATALDGRASIFYNTKEYDKALRIIDSAIDIAGESAERLNAKGATLHAAERFEEALKVFDGAVTKWAEIDFLWMNRGNVLRFMERYAEALASVERALAINRSCDALILKSIIYFCQERFADSISSADEVLLREPNRGDALAILIEAHTQSGNFALAMDLISREVNLPSKWANLRANTLRREFLVKLGRYDDALEEYGRAGAALSTSDAINKGIALLGLHRFDEAARAFWEALPSNLDDARRGVAMSGTLFSLYRGGHIDEVLTLLDRIEMDSEASPSLCVLKGQWLNIVGHHNEALAACNEALTLDPTDESALKLRTLILSASDNESRSR